MFSVSATRFASRMLAAYGSSVERKGPGWDVTVASRASAIGVVLTALHECMAENEIRLVRVTVGGHTYAMEPVTAQQK